MRGGEEPRAGHAIASCLSRGDDAEVVSELLRRGAKWGRAFENRDGQTAYQLARRLVKAKSLSRPPSRRENKCGADEKKKPWKSGARPRTGSPWPRRSTHRTS